GGVVQGYEGGPAIHHRGGVASYSPMTDRVSMPKPESFESPEEYYSTLFHEYGHSTGHRSRLAREGVTNPVRFASHEYSREELVAEMTAAFLSARCGIELATLDNSASYIGSWLRVLRGCSERRTSRSLAPRADVCGRPRPGDGPRAGAGLETTPRASVGTVRDRCSVSRLHAGH